MKNKSTILLVSLVIILSIVAYFVMKGEEGIGGSKPMSDFAIENTEDITKIIITDNNKSKVELELIDGVWMLNKEERALEVSVFLLLKTFKHIAVQSSVPEYAKRNVAASLSSHHKKVEIFVKGKLTKTYYVGSPTKDHYGTYMLLMKNGVKSSEPYVMHIPGFNGFLESRFHAIYNYWKYSGVFVYDPLDISEITVNHTRYPEESFKITHDNMKVSLKEINGDEIETYHRELVENYILQFKKVYYNKILEFSQAKIDSIKSSPVIYSVTVKDVKGDSKTVNFVYKLRDVPEEDVVTGEMLLYDENYILGYIKEENQIMVFQYHTLGNIFSKKSYFIPKN